MTKTEESLHAGNEIEISESHPYASAREKITGLSSGRQAWYAFRRMEARHLLLELLEPGTAFALLVAADDKQWEEIADAAWMKGFIFQEFRLSVGNSEFKRGLILIGMDAHYHLSRFSYECFIKNAAFPAREYSLSMIVGFYNKTGTVSSFDIDILRHDGACYLYAHDVSVGDNDYICDLLKKIYGIDGMIAGYMPPAHDYLMGSSRFSDTYCYRNERAGMPSMPPLDDKAEILDRIKRFCIGKNEKYRDIPVDKKEKILPTCADCCFAYVAMKDRHVDENMKIAADIRKSGMCFQEYISEIDGSSSRDIFIVAREKLFWFIARMILISGRTQTDVVVGQAKETGVAGIWDLNLIKNGEIADMSFTSVIIPNNVESFGGYVQKLYGCESFEIVKKYKVVHQMHSMFDGYVWEIADEVFGWARLGSWLRS